MKMKRRGALAHRAQPCFDAIDTHASCKVKRPMLACISVVLVYDAEPQRIQQTRSDGLPFHLFEMFGCDFQVSPSTANRGLSRWLNLC